MNSVRSLLIVGLAIAVLGAIGVFALGPGLGGDAPPLPPAAVSSGEPPPAPDTPAAVIADDLPEPGRTAAPMQPAEAQPTREDGLIRGHVTLSAGIIGQIQSINITIHEAMQGPGDPPRTPFLLTRVEPVGNRTPQFAYDDIPFSEFGYWVRAWAEGVNGSRKFVQVTQETPIADVELAVTEGVAFSILLRDAQKYPVGDQRVYLVPVGEPRGRKVLLQESDAFGAAVFETVLQGEYEVRVGAVNAPVNEPKRVHVQMHAGVRSATIEIPTGHELVVLVEVRGGWGLEGASVRLLATDSVQLRQYEMDTAYGGRAVFRNVLPGSYQLDVRAERHSPMTRRVIIGEEAAPEPIRIALNPTR